jgi:hypothetical protein
VVRIGLSGLATWNPPSTRRMETSMARITRRWAIGAALLVATIAASRAENQPVNPDVKSASTRVSEVGLLSVLITPANPVPPNTYCIFTANVSGGTAPYHYQWAVNNSPIGSDSQWLNYLTPSGGGFRIQVFVTDATSAQASDSKIISISSIASC